MIPAQLLNIISIRGRRFTCLFKQVALKTHTSTTICTRCAHKCVNRPILTLIYALIHIKHVHFNNHNTIGKLEIILVGIGLKILPARSQVLPPQPEGQYFKDRLLL